MSDPYSSPPQHLVCCDPGLSGGFASSCECGLPELSRMSDPWPALDRDTVLVIEQQQGSGRRSDFNFGVHYGRLLAWGESAGEVVMVRPLVWQKPLRLKADTYPSRKRELKHLAVDRMPYMSGITLYTCDALLIWMWRCGTIRK